jgi:hypothetical protein
LGRISGRSKSLNTPKLQSYRATELQSYRATELQSYRATELQSYRATELQNKTSQVTAQLNVSRSLRRAGKDISAMTDTH